MIQPILTRIGFILYGAKEGSERTMYADNELWLSNRNAGHFSNINKVFIKSINRTQSLFKQEESPA